jgi:CBS domain-containing protein
MLKVRDIMTTELVTVSPELELRETVDLFADTHISGAPVVSRARVVGVVSANDVLAFQASTPAVPAERPDQMEQGEWGAPEEWEEGAEAPAAFFTEMWSDAGADVVERISAVQGPEWDLLAEHTVAETMTRRVCSVRPEASVADAAAYMMRAGVHRLLVMEGADLLGIVTTTDIVRAVAERRLA